MEDRSWSFEGKGYSLQRNPEAMDLSLNWQDLVEIPACFPFAMVQHGQDSFPNPLERSLGSSCRFFRKGNRNGTFSGLSERCSWISRENGFTAGSDTQGTLSDSLFWHAECLPDCVVFTAGFRNCFDRDLRLYNLVPLAGRIRFLKGSLSEWRFYKMSSNTTMPSGSLSLGESERNFGFKQIPSVMFPSVLKRMLVLPHESVSFRKGSFSSQWFTLLVHKGNGPSVLMGFLDTDRHFSTLSLDTREGCFQATAHGEGCVLPPNRGFTAHRLMVAFGKDPFSCVDAYLSSLAVARPPRFRPVSLWGTWYSGFHDRFEWNDLLENLDQAASAPERIEYFQLDDGYQKALGDWTETKQNLPEGLPGFSEKVRSRGMKPGIWVAPFAVGKSASVFRDHPGWLVRKESGRPVLAGFMPGRFRLRPYYGLDLSHPEVLDWLGGLFKTLVEWGFQLFKLDYLAAGALPGIRADKGITSARAYGKGLSVIRDAVGDHPLLGALAPQLSGVGIMDIQRVSTDSSFGGNHWSPGFQRFLGDSVTPGLRNNLRNNLTRVLFADRLWTNDCDAILYGDLSPAEQKTHISTNLLLGSVFQIGHDLRKGGYPWAEISRLTGLRPLIRIVPDLFERELPQEAFVVALNRQGKRILLYLLLNLTERALLKTLRDPADYLDHQEVRWDKGQEFWSGKAVDSRPGSKITVPPHGSFLIELPLVS